jgi:hypothetical protein
MDRELWRQMEALQSAPIDQLRSKYRELFGEEPRGRRRESLFRQVVWRMQALAEGGLSERARARALAIANDADIRVLAPRGRESSEEASFAHGLGRDPRIPPPGAVLQREYGGSTIAVKVLANGCFEHESKQYSSLSAVATAVTGTRWNGLAFFGLTSRSRVMERRNG